MPVWLSKRRRRVLAAAAGTVNWLAWGGHVEPAGIKIRTVRGFGYMLEEYKDLQGLQG